MSKTDLKPPLPDHMKKPIGIKAVEAARLYQTKPLKNPRGFDTPKQMQSLFTTSVVHAIFFGD